MIYQAQSVPWCQMKTYDELFETRGSAYDRAMRRYPRARDQEFRQVVERALLGEGMLVADVPAGGGRLRRRPQ